MPLYNLLVESTNDELKKLYESDVAERTRIGIEDSGNNLLEHDRQRRKRVKEIIKKGSFKSASDYHHAALIFQHGDSSDDFKQANDLAKTAMEMGDESAKWLYAATLDRYLISVNQPQKFGTQFEQDNKGGWSLKQPIDEGITDEERAKYNVPPLAKALQKFKKKYGIK